MNKNVQRNIECLYGALYTNWRWGEDLKWVFAANIPPMSILTLVRQTGGDESDGWDSDGPRLQSWLSLSLWLPICFHFMFSGHQESDQIMEIPNVLLSHSHQIQDIQDTF